MWILEVGGRVIFLNNLAWCLLLSVIFVAIESNGEFAALNQGYQKSSG